MGTFEGHVIPSIIYTTLSLWWGFVTAVKYVSSLKKNKSRFKGSTIMPCFFLPTKKLRGYPIESLIKVIFLSIHTLVEIYTGVHLKGADFKGPGYTIEYENLHHICMLSGFLIGAIIEILIYYGVPFPNGTAYMFNLLAFLIQAFLMTGHLHGDLGLEYHVHMLWSAICVLTLIAACAETYNPDNIWAVYTRIFLFCTQGTWLMQIAFVVWPHTTNPSFLWGTDHGSITWLTISLMYHLVGNAIILMLQYIIVFYSIEFFYKFYRKYEMDIDEDSKMLRIELGNEKEYKMLMNELDLDEE